MRKHKQSLSDRFIWGPILFILKNPFWLVLTFLLLIISYGFLPTFGDNYSNGVREGLLQKYTVKGLFWKTGEGELVLNSFKIGTVGKRTSGGTEEFNFSGNPKKDFTQFVGKNVRVYYTKAIHRPYSQGSTNYRVDSIQVLE
jgi:hypothetical protein